MGTGMQGSRRWGEEKGARTPLKGEMTLIKLREHPGQPALQPALTIRAHHRFHERQGPHKKGLFAGLHLAEEKLHQFLGVGASCGGWRG